jgi:hypothetical protein
LMLCNGFTTLKAFTRLPLLTVLLCRVGAMRVFNAGATSWARALVEVVLDEALRAATAGAPRAATVMEAIAAERIGREFLRRSSCGELEILLKRRKQVETEILKERLLNFN